MLNNNYDSIPDFIGQDGHDPEPLFNKMRVAKGFFDEIDGLDWLPWVRGCYDDIYKADKNAKIFINIIEKGEFFPEWWLGIDYIVLFLFAARASLFDCGVNMYRHDILRILQWTTILLHPGFFLDMVRNNLHYN